VAETSADYAARYPLLHTPERWEWAGMDATFSMEPPPDDLVTNVHVIGYVGDRIVLCRDTRPVWFLPGGTREANESIEACADRELCEEAGATLAGPLHWMGAHYGTSDHPEPYRPWQPHPHKAWLWCYADVHLIGPPTNPPDGEHVVEVRTTTPAEAQSLLTSDNPWSPDLVALAQDLRTTRH
jgi:8-oxo-dGTP diphosphatase